MRLPKTNLTDQLTGTIDERWRAVVSRDARFDGIFVFAVSSTGVYCRPSCPARRPKQVQVLFFDRFETAERAGFRACRRCKPQLARAADPELQRVQRICRSIESHLEEALTLSSLSTKEGVSSFNLLRLFKRKLGITPRQYADACRLHHFKIHVKKGDSVTNAIYEAGYGSSRGLYERAPLQLGMTPATYRRGGLGMRIDYTITECSLGQLLVASTERGICAVRLGDSATELKAAFLKEYSAADIRRDSSALRGVINLLLNYLAGQHPDLDLPLDVRTTAFQWRVWEELRRIPYGSTRSYSEIAKAIGHPKAVRAVARACAANPVALVIPCHRVIQADRSLGGYRWGSKRKRALLAQESKTETGHGAGGRLSEFSVSS
jgi:AraC family transcriptional regulator, regulatory protein of adaptative response / methylated-DNA-[protein]-cysteine methyltransferase